MPAQLMTYRYDGINGDSVRLLTLLPGAPQQPISCHLHIVSLKDGPCYETLSYAWGSPQLTRIIVVNDRPLPITENLYIALLYLRRPEDPLVLWVDAICINQKNVPERSQQVAKMRQIYKGSSRVYVWLGVPTSEEDLYHMAPSKFEASRVDSAVDSNDAKEHIATSQPFEKGVYSNQQGACKLLRKDSGIDCDYGTAFSLSSHSFRNRNPFALVEHFLKDKHFLELPGFEQKDDGSYVMTDLAPFQKMYEFFTQAWWSRLWCVQEILLAPDALIVHGKWSVSWDELKTASTNNRRHLLTCCDQVRTLLPWRVRDDEIIERPDTVGYHDLDRLLRTYAHRKCQDPRDKVYGLLGLVDASLYSELAPNYSKDQYAVFHDATMAIFRRNPGSLRFLTGFRISNSQSTLPTWVRDLTWAPDIATTWVEKHRFDQYDLYNASREITTQPNFPNSSLLKLRGVRVSTIAKMGPTRTTSNLIPSLDLVKNWSSLVGLDLPSATDGFVCTKQRRFWRTLHADVAIDSELEYKWRRCTDVDIEHYITTMSKIFRTGGLGDGDCRQALSAITTLGKNLFVADSGTIGLCYPGAKVGDEVWILAGGNVPFVLRPDTDESVRDSQETYHRLIGDCYLDGYMDGEIFQDGNPDIKDVFLV